MLNGVSMHNALTTDIPTDKDANRIYMNFLALFAQASTHKIQAKARLRGTGEGVSLGIARTLSPINECSEGKGASRGSDHPTTQSEPPPSTIELPRNDMAREREETKIAAMLRQGHGNDNGTATVSSGPLSPGRRNELEEVKNLIRTNKGVFHNPEVRKQARRVYRMLEKVARKHSRAEKDPLNKSSSYCDLMEKVNLVVYSQSEVQSLETDVSSIDASDIEEEAPVKDYASMVLSDGRSKKEMECGAEMAVVHALPRDTLEIEEAELIKGHDRSASVSRFGFLGMMCVPVSWCGPGDNGIDDPVTGSDGNASICDNIREATVAENDKMHHSAAAYSPGPLALSAREEYLIHLDAASPPVCLERVQHSSDVAVPDKSWHSINPAENQGTHPVQIDLPQSLSLCLSRASTSREQRSGDLHLQDRVINVQHHSL